MNLIKGLRYEAIFRYPNGSYCTRKMFTQKEKLKGYMLWGTKIYHFIPGCQSYTDRMGFWGRIRSFDYTINEGLPKIIDETERDKVLSKENQIIGTIIDTDHFQKINEEARKGKGIQLTLKRVLIGIIILAGIYYLMTGDVLGK